jgi:hypothetical protein
MPPPTASESSSNAQPALVIAPPGVSGPPWAKSNSLYWDAMRVSASDPAKALAEFEAIKKLPREYWPSDLDQRSHQAESRIKAQQH